MSVSGAPAGTRHAEPSFAQVRLLTLEQLYQTGAAYNVTTGLRLRGRADVTRLRDAMRALAERHEALRTAFRLIAGRPLQVVHDAPEIDLTYEDLRGRPADGRQALAYRRATETLTRPFDLAQAPLWRVLLIALGDDESWLVVTFHHIVIDGWSLEVFWRELGCLYGGCGRSQAEDGPPLPPVSMQHSQFAQWERQLLQGERRERQLRYWRRQLAGLPSSLALPTDRPRSKMQTFDGARCLFPLSAELSARAKALAEAHGVTLFMTLLAVFVALLRRDTDQEDLVLGVPAANRARPEVKSLIGFVANTLVLRFDLQGDPTVRELLRRVRRVTLEALTHQALPFELLVRELAPRRDPGHQPLFEVMFSWESGPARVLRLSGLTVEPLALPHSGSSKFDLGLTLGETQEGLQGMLEYRTELFDAPTIERMAGHFRQLLAGAAAAPEERVTRLPVLTATERRLLVGTWSHGSPAGRPECLHTLVERQVDREPAAVAVRSGAVELDYAQLDRAANRLARALRARGAGPEERLAVCLPRGVELVTVLLAALKSGGAYIALDPADPPARLRWMLHDAKPRLLLTTGELRDRMLSGQPLPESCAVLCLDELEAEAAVHASGRLPCAVRPENLAYVVYTSGSTGHPKGAMVPHLAVCNLLDARHPFLPRRGDVVALHSPVTFDVVAVELWGTLVTGAQLLIAPADRLSVRDYRELAREASCMTITPGLFNLLVEEGVTELSSLRLLDLGGEPLSADHVARARDAAATVTLNSYGPAECTTITTSGTALRRTPFDRVPIGRPIVGVEVYVLDRELQPVPVGVVGELYVGGGCLARGYLHRPALTAERFVPHPFARERSGRLYQTGDMVRWLPDGTLDFLGRRDEQVKLRGFRVELGEVEAVLGTHEQVRAAVAAVREDRPGERRLIGYVVPAGGSTLGKDGRLAPDLQVELRELLRSRLPDYMVPSALAGIAAVPLAANGKVDRRALPAPPVEAAAVTAEGQETPRTPTQRLLAQLWHEVLGVPAVGLDDNFFDLGGDSVGVLRVAGALQRRGIAIPLQALYKAQTIRAAARYLDRETSSERSAQPR